ncbi:MAG: PepSY domain-containing protein [Gammaproteobacteria bacterium]|nr:PepSY domain-containing protein [Gammaproteobacteria bacterium]
MTAVNRSFFISLHMYLAAFFAPVIFLVCISGGLYLVGIKGSVEQTPVFQSTDYAIDTGAEGLKAEVDALLTAAGVTEYEYEYVKVKGNTLYTRPTSRGHYVINLGEGVEVIRAEPSLQSAMIELHKGHGPTAYKTFQKLFAVALLLIVSSGLFLGLSATRLRSRTLATSLMGATVFALLVLI